MAKDKDKHKKEPAEETNVDESEASASSKPVSRRDRAKAFMRALHAGQDMSDENSEANQLDIELGQEIGITGATCGNCQYLEQQLKEALEKADEAEGHYKRMAADFENYRRRVDRERENYQAHGIRRTVEQLLPALDDMDRAQGNLTSDMSPEKLIDSLKLVYNRLLKGLEQLGVKPIPSVGQHFDPKFHEPVQKIETTEHPDGTVVQELRQGYSLKDEVIRPALVNVAANPDEMDNDSDDEAEEEINETDGSDSSE